MHGAGPRNGMVGIGTLSRNGRIYLLLPGFRNKTEELDECFSQSCATQLIRSLSMIGASHGMLGVPVIVDREHGEQDIKVRGVSDAAAGGILGRLGDRL